MTINATRNANLETRPAQPPAAMGTSPQQLPPCGGGVLAAASAGGPGFSPATKNVARSASSEGSQGNPPRRIPPPASSLNGAWIEIFRAGDYGERGAWSADDLGRLAAAYDPRRHAAPVVVGHPAADAPAYGWVRRLRRAGASLWAQLEKVDPAFEALLRAGRFAQRSVALYRHLAAADGPYLRHVGFLGAAPPAVKGLAPVRFLDGDTAPCVAFAFDSSTLTEMTMSEPKSRLDTFFDHLRAFFVAEPADATAPSSPLSPVAPATGPDFAERLATLEQRLETLGVDKHAAEESLSQTEAEKARRQTLNFVETLRSRGRFPPVFDRWGVPAFLERLTQLENTHTDGDPTVRFTAETCSGGVPAAEHAVGLAAWFQDFLSKLPAVIEFREIGTGDNARTAPQARPSAPAVVRFTEPQRGMTVDPASIELAERAEALAAERGISYAAALAQLREERRAASVTA